MTDPKHPLDAAIDELRRSAETCEHNAPIHGADGNHEQAELSLELARSYRAGVAALVEIAHPEKPLNEATPT
jgi:hypothetical protein